MRGSTRTRDDLRHRSGQLRMKRIKKSITLATACPPPPPPPQAFATIGTLKVAKKPPPPPSSAGRALSLHAQPVVRMEGKGGPWSQSQPGLLTGHPKPNGKWGCHVAESTSGQKMPTTLQPKSDKGHGGPAPAARTVLPTEPHKTPIHSKFAKEGGNRCHQTQGPKSQMTQKSAKQSIQRAKKTRQKSEHLRQHKRSTSTQRLNQPAPKPQFPFPQAAAKAPPNKSKYPLRPYSANISIAFSGGPPPKFNRRTHSNSVNLSETNPVLLRTRIRADVRFLRQRKNCYNRIINYGLFQAYSITISELKQLFEATTLS